MKHSHQAVAVIPSDAASGVSVDAPEENLLCRTSDGETPSHFHDLYELTKPRMNFLVVVTTMIGFCVGAAGPVRWRLLGYTVLGTALCAAASAILNQLIERRFDAMMPRTRNRPLAAGRINAAEALTLGIVFAVAGAAVLLVFTNLLTALLGLLTIAWYLGFYTPMKRISTLNTVVGAVPGALPPVMGVAAASGALTPVSLSLFLILFVWQLPHFLAIATLYRDDYEIGGFKMLPGAQNGAKLAARQIMVWSVALVPVALTPTLFGFAGTAYFVTALLLSFGFLAFGFNYATTLGRPQARRLFFASIIYLPLLLGAVVVDRM